MVTASDKVTEIKPEATKHDTIVNMVAQVEKLTEKTVFHAIFKLLDNVSESNFMLGILFDKIVSEEWWKIRGYKSFKEFVEVDVGMKFRKAYYLMSISNALVASEIPWAKVAPMGWSKLKEITEILSLENVDEWVAKIMGPPELTVFQIQEIVKEIKAGSLDSTDVPDATSEFSSKTFKLHADQRENIEAALTKGRKEAETEYDAVALDAICMNYLAGGKVVKPKSLSDTLKLYELEDVLEAVMVVWPEIDLKAAI